MQKHQWWPPPLFTIKGIIFYFEREILEELSKILKFMNFKIGIKLTRRANEYKNRNIQKYEIFLKIVILNSQA